MTISCVINTCALGPDGARRSSKGHGPSYAKRAEILRRVILPRLVGDPDVSEVIVVGEWEPGEGYTYVHAPGPDHNVWDQCFQKAQAAPRGDLVVYLCDDHLPDENFFSRLLLTWAPNKLWDILSPMRLVNGRSVNVGWNDGYVHAHCVVMRRNALNVCPWGDMFNHVRGTWALDVPMTALWRHRDLMIQTDYLLLTHDVENNTYEHGA